MIKKLFDARALKKPDHRLVRSCLSSLDHDPDPRGQSCRASAIERIDVVASLRGRVAIVSKYQTANQFRAISHGCSEINIVHRRNRVRDRETRYRYDEKSKNNTPIYFSLWHRLISSQQRLPSLITSIQLFRLFSVSFIFLLSRARDLSFCRWYEFSSFFFSFFFASWNTVLCIEQPCHEPCFPSSGFFVAVVSPDEKYGGCHDQRNGGVLRDNYINAFSDHTPAYKIFLG